MIIVSASECHRKITIVSKCLNFLPFLKLMGAKKTWVAETMIMANYFYAARPS